MAVSGFGQDPTPQPLTWSAGPIDFTGAIDGYYDFNFNHPRDLGNQLYNFDVLPNQFGLNMIEFGLGHDPDPVGFHIDFGFGKAFEIVHGSDASALQHLRQAYVSFKPKKDRNLELDFGEFVTSAGAEVIESYSNWNYSRSLLFSWAIPYYHFGLRVSDQWGHFQGGVQVVNGWNNVVDNNSGKTLGLVGNLVYKKFSWNNTYYTGPENAGTNRGFRNLYDTVLMLTPADRVNAYVNFDYGSNRSDRTDTWTGIAIASRFQVNSKNALTPRIEWFDDEQGFETGAAQKVKELTLTYEYKLAAGLLTRLEYRHDWSDQPFFEKGGTLNASKSQDTLALAFIAFFGPKR